MHKAALALLTLSLAFAQIAQAEWIADNDYSKVNFVTNKIGTVADVHGFNLVTGTLQSDGSAQVAIDLASIQTILPDRDQRLRDILFNVANYPQAVISAKVDPALLSLGVGEQQQLTLPLNIAMHGFKVDTVANVLVSRLSETKILVSSLEPVVLYAFQFGFIEGIEELRVLAGLPSINPTVTVGFQLTFEDR